MPISMMRAFVLHLNLFVINLILGSRISSCKQPLNSMGLGDRLYSNQTLVSQNGAFTLGFFSNSPNAIYLGLWFADTASSPKLWVANRDSPAPTEVFLELTNEGNMILVDSKGKISWMSATSEKNVEMAVLSDTGNLILQSNETATVVWQSFDYPTDTWLPEMKLTSETIFRSWKSLINPAADRFSFRMDDYGALELLWNDYVSYWKADLSIQPSTFVDTTQNRTYTIILTFFSNATSSYYTWMERDNQRCYIALGQDGVLRSHAWNEQLKEWFVLYSNPTNACEVEHLCGPYGICDGNTLPFCKCPPYLTPADSKGWDQNDWSMGCVQARALNCYTDRFVALDYISYNLSGMTSTGSNDSNMCEKLCSHDCTCVAYICSADGMCFLQDTPLVNSQNSPNFGGSFSLRVSGSDNLSPSRRTLKVPSIIGGVAGFIFLLLLVSVCLFIKWRAAVFRASVETFSPGLVKFSYKDLQKATNNFSQTLGAGGFGSVFAGRLMDNSLVAVKKLETRLTQGEKQFLAEVNTIGSIYHMNLVTLRGFCAEDSHRLLVYERLPNGSLDRYLFKANSGGSQQLLDWNTRVGIALGTARGIAYLHEDCRDCIIHLDIKPENILLDANFCAKLSDFGLAKLIGREYSRILTTMRGTRGYLAPEWLENVPITAKVDVYSYGMTVLEIISGRKNIDVKAELDRWYFPLWAYKQMKLGKFALLADERLDGRYELQQLKKLVQVALWCIQDEESVRPAMRRVVKMLGGMVEVTEPPIPKSLALLEIESYAASHSAFTGN